MRAVAPSPVATRKPRRKRRYLLQFLATAACGVAAGVGFAAAIHVPQVDSIASFSPKLVTQIHDRSGTVAFASYARERRLMLDQGEIPPCCATPFSRPRTATSSATAASTRSASCVRSR